MGLTVKTPRELDLAKADLLESLDDSDLCLTSVAHMRQAARDLVLELLDFLDEIDFQSLQQMSEDEVERELSDLLQTDSFILQYPKLLQFLRQPTRELAPTG